jgi:hypothetical protein
MIAAMFYERRESAHLIDARRPVLFNYRALPLQ